ncbi:MAG: hypothetical protein E4G90_03270 [Gemmatimonadales bacterium]|nr:MAG: hypothetical protein E4G90_03270 [Gemmatimonadales bacterium]
MKKVVGGQLNNTLFAMVYGQGKLRKTTAALMAPMEWRPMAYFDTDNGAAIRLKVLATTKEERERMGVVEVVPDACGPWMKDGIDFYYPEKKYYEDCYEFATQMTKQYKLVVIDTASRMADGIMEEIKMTSYGAAKSRVTMQSGKLATVHPLPADYGMTQDRVMEIFSALDNSPAHVLILSHEKTAEIEEGADGVVKRTIAGPRTSGNALLEVLPAIMDVALRLEVKSAYVAGKLTNTVNLRATNHGFYLAGDRSGLFTDGEEFNPSTMWERFGKLVSMTAMPSEGVKV